MAASWEGSAHLTDRVFAYVGAIVPTRTHAHHAVQLVAVGGDGTVEIEDAHATTTARAYVIPADAPHAIRSRAPLALFVYVDPESDVGRALEQRVVGEGSLAWSTAGASFAALARVEPGSVRAVVEDLMSAVPPQVSARDLHASIRDALAQLPGLARDGEVRVGSLAGRVGLSEGRLMHLFREQVGVPIRAYVRWLRLRLAVEAIQGGASLTAAAHASGFFDSSHFSNVFQETFGVSPSEAVRSVVWVA